MSNVQLSDKIIYMGKEYSLSDHSIMPLAEYLDENKIFFQAVSTMNHRGYTAVWSVSNDELYLQQLEGHVSLNDKPWILVPPEERKTEEVGRDYVFPNTDDFFADWFTGCIFIDLGNAIDDNGWDSSTYECTLVLHFRAGTLIQTCLNENYSNEDFAAHDRNRLFPNLFKELDFGKHTGRKIVDLYTGEPEIGLDQLEVINDLFRDSPLTSSKSMQIIQGLLGREEFDRNTPPGQIELFKLLPDPDYIEWCLLNVDKIKLNTAEIELLEDMLIRELRSINSFENELWPVFNFRRFKFSDQVKKEAEAASISTYNDTRSSYVVSEEDSDEYYYNDSNSFYLSDDGDDDYYCPACQEPRPCGCNYSVEKYC